MKRNRAILLAMVIGLTAVSRLITFPVSEPIEMILCGSALVILAAYVRSFTRSNLLNPKSKTERDLDRYEIVSKPSIQP